MVLDVKALTWAAQNDLDTAKLKAAKIKLYGKWYFPQIPEGVPLLSLESGERRVFEQPMIAGEVVWAAERDLKHARLGPYKDLTDEELAAEETPSKPAVEPPPEPLLAMSRVEMPLAEPLEQTGGYRQPVVHSVLRPLPSNAGMDPSVDPSTIHMPRASMAPLLLGVGVAIVFLGLITHVLVVVVGLIWVAAGAAGWIRIGLLEAAETGDHAAH